MTKTTDQERNLTLVFKDLTSTTNVANRNKQSLSGGNHYAKKFNELHAECVNLLRPIEKQISENKNDTVKQNYLEIVSLIEVIFKATTKNKERTASKRRVEFLL